MRSIFLGILVLLATNIFAADIDDIPPRVNGETNGIGAGGTVFYTWGFTYRHHFANRFGVTTTLGGWIDRHGGHLGNELGALYTLAHHHHGWSWLPKASTRVYLVGYLGTIYRRNHLIWEDNRPNGEKPKRENILDIGLGVGPGMEFFFNNYFGLHLELPWMTFMRLSNNRFAFHSTYPHFGGGLVYYF